MNDAWSEAARIAAITGITFKEFVTSLEILATREGDLKGSMHDCQDCSRRTTHFTAPGGLPVCNRCGATPEEN